MSLLLTATALPEVVDYSSLRAVLSRLSLQTLLPALVTLVVGIVLAKLLIRLFDRALARSTRLDKSLHGFLRALFRILLYAIVALITAGQLGVNTSSLVALLSVVSLALSLAIQGTLSNIAGGMMVLSSHPFHVGDYVEIGGIEGTVAEIGLFHTRLVTADNKNVFVPNSEVSSAKIVNFTAEQTRRVDLTFTASYDSAPDRVCAALLRACAAHPELTLPDPPPEAHVTAYGDSSIEYILKFWCSTPQYWPARYAVTEQVKREFDADGLEMSYPHLNVHLDAPNS